MFYAINIGWQTQLQKEFSIPKTEIIELANKVINNTNRSMSREDFLASIEKSFELFDFWTINSSNLRETVQADKEFDVYLSNFRRVEKFNELCSSFRILRNEFIKSDQYLRNSISINAGVFLLDPGDLGLLTTISGVEEYVVE